ncbi:hypothetical protein Tco_0277510 [Tanacetum coccineum]
MSSITAQQTKLDLELVPKENRLDIRKCNGRIPHGLTPIEPTFQVVLYVIALTPCYPAFLITVNVPEIVSAKESTQIYGAILPECLTSPAMKESKAYKTFQKEKIRHDDEIVLARVRVSTLDMTMESILYLIV